MGNTRASVRRTPSPKAAVTRLDNLLHYTIDITNNHKRFPKSVRYTITDRLINELLEANGHARVAARTEPYNKVSYKQFKKHLQKAIDHLTKFESLMIIANSYCRPANMGYWAMLEEEAYKGLTEWMSYENKRNYNRKARKKRNKNKPEDIYLIYKNFDPNNPRNSL